MSKKIILALIFLFASIPIFSQSSAGRFSLKDVSTYWNSRIDLTGYPYIKPFGTSTKLTDSTNYINFSKGINVPNDSMKVGKYLFVGTKGGGIYLDTNRKGEIIYSGVSLQFFNNKENGSMDFWIGEKSSEYYWYKSEGGAGTLLMTLDTVNGLALTNLNISTSSTGQIKIPSDTASDYNGDDAITLNRQSGTLTTKSLTTAAGSLYALTLTNSLITANSKVFASINDGTSSQGLSILYQCRPGSGSGTIVIYNGHATQAFNGTFKIYFVIFN